MLRNLSNKLARQSKVENYSRPFSKLGRQSNVRKTVIPQIRYFSNEEAKKSFRETLEKLKRDRAASSDKIKTEKSIEDIEEASMDPNVTPDESSKTGESEKEEPNPNPNEETSSKINPQELYYKAVSFVGESREFLEDNFRMAWAEMTGSSKPSNLERKFEQASYIPRLISL
jgi:hypothetical protein